MRFREVVTTYREELGGYCAQRGYGSSLSTPLILYLVVCISSICLLLSCIIYNKSVNINKVFS